MPENGVIRTFFHPDDGIDNLAPGILEQNGSTHLSCGVSCGVKLDYAPFKGIKVPEEKNFADKFVFVARDVPQFIVL
ncbi:MAG: hypothetical protein RR323_06065 [Raoultibacter sp.]